MSQSRDKGLKANIQKDKKRKEDYINKKKEGKLTLRDRLTYIL
jgi:hypothetical protein